MNQPAMEPDLRRELYKKYARVTETGLLSLHVTDARAILKVVARRRPDLRLFVDHSDLDNQDDT